MNAVANIQNTAADMVPANAVAREGLTTTTRHVGIGTMAKAAGVNVSTMKARLAVQGGSSAVVAATATGKGIKAAAAALAEAQIARIVNHGHVDYAQALREVCSVNGGIAIAYVETTRANGRISVKREEWLKVRDTLATLALMTGKTGKPTPLATTAKQALMVWDTIQGAADKARA